MGSLIKLDYLIILCKKKKCYASELFVCFESYD